MVGKVANGLNTWIEVFPLVYEKDGKKLAVVYTIVEEETLGEGPTLLIAGEIERTDLELMEKNLINGTANKSLCYFIASHIKEFENKRMKVVKVNMKVADRRFEEIYDFGSVIADSIMSSKKLREKLEKHFKHAKINFKAGKECAEFEVPEVPRAEEYGGKFFAKVERKVGLFLKKKVEYVLPLEGLSKIWYRVHHIDTRGRRDLQELIDKLYYYREKENKTKKDLEEMRACAEEVKRHLKMAIEGKI